MKVEFRTRASLESISSDEPIEDPVIIKMLVNIGVATEPPIRHFAGGIRVTDIAGKLVRAADGGLEFALSIGVAREPNAEELKKLAASCDALLYTKWGLNLDFDLPDDERLDDVHIQLSDGFTLATA